MASPASAAAHISCIRRGATLATTEMSPLRTHQNQGAGTGIIAAIDGKTGGRAGDQLDAAIHVAGGVLDADNVRDFRQAQRGVIAQSATVRPGTL
jgi:hypothetical protein